MNKPQPEARVRVHADITVSTQAKLLKLIEYYKQSKIGLITQLIEAEYHRLGF